MAELEQINPLSSKYVGAEEHRRRVEAKFGKFTKYGNPTQENMERALPGQVHTMLNVLRFVDTINAMLARRLVHVAHGGRAAPFEVLMAWEEAALQARFSGALGYLKASKRHASRRTHCCWPRAHRSGAPPPFRRPIPL